MTQFNILFAEDKDNLRFMNSELVLTLFRESYLPVIDLCADGGEFLEKARRKKHNFYMTDDNMPRMNGSDALRKLREEGDYTPALIVTGNDRNLGTYGDISYVGVLPKPFGIDELRISIEKLLPKVRMPAKVA